MAHRMILATADLSEIVAVVVARKIIAGVAQVGERCFRTAEVGTSTVSTGPSVVRGE